MNVIDRYMSFSLQGKEYRLLFTIKSTLMCEKELAAKNLILTMAGLASAPLSVGDAYALFKWGLLGADKYQEKDIDSLFGGYLEEYGMVELQGLVAQAVNRSGLMGTGKNKTALPQEQRPTAAPES